MSILRGMHPARKNDSPLRTYSSISEKIKISSGGAKKLLFAIGRRDHSAVGVFGWAADFLFPVRTSPFLTELARLVARMANADRREIPDVLAFALVTGGLFALHKLPPAERKTGADPKIRPMNVGCVLLKWALKLVNKHKKTVKAVKNLGPIQLGLCASGHGNSVSRLPLCVEVIQTRV